jgi:CubicO group peptidase (beta-lactamase class C family)
LDRTARYSSAVRFRIEPWRFLLLPMEYSAVSSILKLSARDDYQTLDEAVAQIVALPAVGQSGEHFQYGGLAMQVAWRMAEIAADQSFNEIFQSRLAQPLGMSGSGYFPVSKEPGFSPTLGGLGWRV